MGCMLLSKPIIYLIPTVVCLMTSSSFLISSLAPPSFIFCIYLCCRELSEPICLFGEDWCLEETSAILFTTSSANIVFTLSANESLFCSVFLNFRSSPKYCSGSSILGLAPLVRLLSIDTPSCLSNVSCLVDTEANALIA